MRFGILAVLVFLLAESPGFAGNFEPIDSSPVTAGGLECFTVVPAEPTPRNATRTASCDELCAERGAACSGVAVGAMSPPPTCAARYITPDFENCRCCKVAK